MDDTISRAEHEEFSLRIAEENRRQNKRIEVLEANVRRIECMNTSIEKLALNMENMLKEQKNQGKRLEILESRDGEMWRKVVGYLVTAVLGIFVGYYFKMIGIF